MTLCRTVIFICWSHFTAHKHVNNAIVSTVGGSRGIFSLGVLATMTSGLAALQLVKHSICAPTRQHFDRVRVAVVVLAELMNFAVTSEAL